MSVRGAVKTELRRHPVQSTRLASLLERAGLASAARRLTAAADIVTVRPPYPSARPVSMVRVEGTDQIAAALAADGWLGFERPLPDVFATLVRATRGQLTLDVGANTGFYALVAAAVDPHAEVHAFEPYPPVLDLLRANLAVNRGIERVAARVTVIDCAVGRASGDALLHVPDPSHGLVETSASLNPEFRVEGRRSTVRVAVVPLDEHLAEFGNPTVGLVKIDVESLEHEVLEGAAALLARDRPFVVIEVLPTSDVDALERVRAMSAYVDVCLRPTVALVGRPIVFDPDGWNHLLVPEERLTEAERLVGSCGLVVER